VLNSITGNAKTADAKTADARTADAKTADAKTADAKNADAKTNTVELFVSRIEQKLEACHQKSVLVGSYATRSDDPETEICLCHHVF
jgi:DNA-directed RNA polymerase subunit M/transcription elongation factor TFIIS